MYDFDTQPEYKIATDSEAPDEERETDSENGQQEVYGNTYISDVITNNVTSESIRQHLESIYSCWCEISMFYMQERSDYTDGMIKSIQNRANTVTVWHNIHHRSLSHFWSAS